jgi:hypothetical protein
MHSLYRLTAGSVLIPSLGTVHPKLRFGTISIISKLCDFKMVCIKNFQRRKAMLDFWCTFSGDIVLAIYIVFLGRG